MQVRTILFASAAVLAASPAVAGSNSPTIPVQTRAALGALSDADAKSPAYQHVYIPEKGSAAFYDYDTTSTLSCPSAGYASPDGAYVCTTPSGASGRWVRGLAASATIDTTNASNITSGYLLNSRLQTQTVPSIAAMQALPSYVITAFVVGYNAGTTIGGGNFSLASSSCNNSGNGDGETQFPSLSSGGSIISGVCWNRAANEKPLTLYDAGCYGDYNGSSGHDDTACIQRALTNAATGSNPVTYGQMSPYNGISDEVYCPTGTYKVSSKITISGSVKFTGAANISFGGCTLIQTAAGTHLLEIAGNGGNAGVKISNIGLKAVSATHTPGTALLHLQNTSLNVANSVTIDGVWFSTPEDYGVNAEAGDDLLITNSRFDVSAYHAMKLGSTAAAITNAKISNNTFFDIRAGAIDVVNTNGVVLSNNTVYKSAVQIPYFWNNNTSGFTASDGVVISSNRFDGVNNIVLSSVGGIVMANNSIKNATDAVVNFDGGGTVHQIAVTGNTISGAFGSVAPIQAASTSIQGSKIAGNIFYSSNSGVVANITGVNTAGNDLSMGLWSPGSFSGLGNVYNGPQNGVTAVVASPVLNPGTIAAGASSSTTATVNGARLYDWTNCIPATTSWDLPAGISIACFVSASDVVTLRLTNNTAASITGIPATQWIIYDRKL